MDFQGLYDSAWHHPGIAWLAQAAFLYWLFTKAPRGNSTLKWAFVLLAANTALDAWLTGAFSPLTPGTLAYRNFGIAFVIAGDFRFFLLFERFRGGAPQSWRTAIAKAAAWSFIVPVAQAVLVKTFPDTFSDNRKVFLIYEALFFALAAALLFSKKFVKPPGAWVNGLLVFQLLQYGLWVGCDVLILSGQQWALGLRILPNALYYGLMTWSAAQLVPAQRWENG